MRQRVGLCLLALIVVCGTTYGQQGQPAAKATAMAGNINVFTTESSHGGNAPGFTTILWNDIKTSRHSGLFVDVSMECGLMTRNLVKSKGGNKETSVATSAVEVRVLMDGQEAAPGPVTFCQRTQELSATFQGIIDGCLSLDADNNIILDEECLLPEEIELITRTMNANSYNFVLNNVGTGVHHIEVQARMVIDSTESVNTQAEARATIGKGSVTIEEVRMIRGEEYELY